MAPPLPRFDLEDDEALPTTVAPWRTAAALALDHDSERSSSGIRALLESTLAKAEVEEDAQATRQMERPATLPPLTPRSDEIEIEVDEPNDREDERLDALVAVYQVRPTEPPKPPPVPRPTAAAASTRSRRKMEKKPSTRERVIAELERWASLDLRIRLLALAVWTGLCVLVTLLVR